MRNISGAASHALCVCSLFSFGLAHASGQGFFVDAGVGRTDPDGNADNDTAYRVGLGYRWAVGEQADLGIRTGYVDLGTVATGTETTIGANNTVTRPFDIDGRFATLGAEARIGFAPQWHLDLRGGYLRGDQHSSIPRISFVEDPHGWTAGAGVGYDLREHWTIGVGYDEYRISVSDVHFNVGIVDAEMEYRF